MEEEREEEMTEEEFMERKESTVRSLLLQLAGKGFTVDQVNEVLRAAAKRMAKCMLAELAIIIILAFAAGITVWKG